jgi:hypothetical protein
MKILVLFALVLSATALFTTLADAASRSRSSAAIARAHQQSFNSIRAHERDPAKNYRGYPNWARSALAPRGGD